TFRGQIERDRARARRILDRIRYEIVDDRADLLGVADDQRWFQFRFERDHSRERRELVLLDDAAQYIGQQHRAERLRLHRAGLMVGEQILDQLLQRQRVLADDANDLALLGCELAANVVAEQLDTLAHRGQRCLQLMRDMAQEAVLLLLEIGQPRAQPFETLADVAQVLRSVDLDPMREVRRAHLPDRLVELPDRAGDQDGEQDGKRQRDAGSRKRQVAPLLPALRGDIVQLHDRALRQVVGGTEQRLRAVGKLRVALGELRMRIGWPRRYSQ